MSAVETGRVYLVENYPFVRGAFSKFSGEDYEEVQTWNPGVRFETCGQYGEDAETICDGFGKQILTVIDVHKPGKYPTRVFYTAHFITPDGTKFGKGKLRITTIDAFRRRADGFKLVGRDAPKLAVSS